MYETFTVTTKPGTKVRCDVELQPQVTTPVAFDQYILSGMQTTLVVLSQNEVLWFVSDTASQPIASGNYYTTPVLFDTTTYYIEERYVDDTLTCISPRSSVTVYVIDTTSISSMSPIENLESRLAVYPNPADNYITIENHVLDNLTLNLYDSNGKQIFTQQISQSARIDISWLTPGAYFVQAVYDDGINVVTKIVKRGK